MLKMLVIIFINTKLIKNKTKYYILLMQNFMLIKVLKKSVLIDAVFFYINLVRVFFIPVYKKNIKFIL